MLSLTGTWMQSVAQGWLVLQLTDSPFQVGLVTTLATLPVFLLTLPGGVLADRVDKRRLIFLLQAGMLAEALALALLTATGQVTVGWVMGLAFFFGLLTAFEVPAREEELESLPIGRPISNTDAWVLDRDGGLAPLGSAGELYLGGDGLAWGYAGRPGSTAAVFVPHPFSATPGARLYRSGDLARLLPSGDIEYLGRIDFQVKVRGFRIELGEIEGVLGRHEAVREKIALTRGSGADQQLLAFVVAAEGASVVA